MGGVVEAFGVRAVLGLVCAALCGLAACQPSSNICGEQTQELTRPDGGEWRCVSAEDCPRTEDTVVCVSPGGYEEPCVSCTDTRCVKHLPESCG